MAWRCQFGQWPLLRQPHGQWPLLRQPLAVYCTDAMFEKSYNEGMLHLKGCTFQAPCFAVRGGVRAAATARRVTATIVHNEAMQLAFPGAGAMVSEGPYMFIIVVAAPRSHRSGC